jgi:hypothetical protein
VSTRAYPSTACSGLTTDRVRSAVIRSAFQSCQARIISRAGPGDHSDVGEVR